MLQDLPLGFHEKVIYQLRSLYNRYGYTQYKMSKFEEYDLYARNKDFLISDSIITFTDTNGKLMALKPDVTLSIVRNSKVSPGCVQKLYYNESVYRVAKGNDSFREITQVGLECLGSIDDYSICEVLTLAAQTLRSISPDSILDISHLGILTQLIDAIGVPADKKDTLIRCIGEKNIHEMTALLKNAEVEDGQILRMQKLISTSGVPGEVLDGIVVLLEPVIGPEALGQLQRVMKALAGSGLEDMLRLDFSAVDDIRYYNGFVFKGFIHGLPGSVLSGGQYDKLMRRMKRSAGAIGFAVYMDMLEQLEPRRKDFDVDTLLLYGPDTDPAAIREQVVLLNEQGRSVLAQPGLPENIRARQILKFHGSEVKPLEDHA